MLFVIHKKNLMTELQHLLINLTDVLCNDATDFNPDQDICLKHLQIQMNLRILLA